MYPFVDNLLSFRTKMYRLDLLNLYQFLFQRMGIGNRLSYRICLYMGYSPYYKAKKIKPSSRMVEVKEMLFDYSIFFDKNVKKIESDNIDKLIKNRHYKGIRHKYKLPTRGQRSRTNANTQRYKNSTKIKKIKIKIKTNMSIRTKKK